MDIKGIIENIKDWFSSLFQRVMVFYKVNKIRSLMILILDVFIILLLVILFSFAGKNKKVKGNDTNIILSETPLIPKSPEIQEDYQLSRTSSDKWSEEEANEWFTKPSASDLDSLSKTNDKIISDILGVAP